jgi:thiamine-monophosphate kinase
VNRCKVNADGIRPGGGRVISVSDEGEFGLIARILARLPASPDVVVPPGDDAAVVAAPDGRVVVSTDVLVEGRHFRRDWSPAYAVGRRAAAANLADIVAMGARPTALLVALVVPPSLDATWVDGLTDGLRDEAALVGASVVGGDLSAGDLVTIAATALGDLGGRSPVTRSGAKPGDIVRLAGWPGRAAAGLELLRRGRAEHPMAEAHRRPTIDYAGGLALAAEASAMIDVSDGLLADLGHIAVGSQVRIEVTAAAIPVDPLLAEVAAELGVDAFDWVAAGGDDHGFVATVAGSAGSAVGAPAIGRVVALPAGERPAVVVVDRAPPKLGGHQHFSS